MLLLIVPYPRRVVHAIRRASLPQGVHVPVQRAEQQLYWVARAGDEGRQGQGAPVAGLRRQGVPLRCRRHREEELNLGLEVRVFYLLYTDTSKLSYFDNVTQLQVFMAKTVEYLTFFK